MIIVIGDRNFLFSLEVISYFNGFFMYLAFQRSHCEFIGYCSSYCKIFETGLFARMNACQGRVPPTGLSYFTLNIGPCMLECIGLSVSRS